jgi:hypothetical protein
MMIEGSGSRAGSGSGSIPVTSGSGSGSRRPKNTWIRWIRIRNTGIREGKKTGSGTNNPDHISESLENFFGLKYLNSFSRIRDPGWEKFGSGITIPDPQHWLKSMKKLIF